MAKSDALGQSLRVRPKGTELKFGKEGSGMEMMKTRPNTVKSNLKQNYFTTKMFFCVLNRERIFSALFKVPVLLPRKFFFFSSGSS